MLRRRVPSLRTGALLSNRLTRARVGTFLTFALGGLLCGVWVSRMPALSGKLGIGDGEVGVILLVWGLAALVAMQLLRGVMARAGSARVLRVAAPLAAGLTAVMALMPTYASTLVAVGLFGMAFGITDVSMNAHASVVERAHKRPLMSGMHAGWCVGAMTGGLFGVVTAAAGLSFTLSVLIVALAALPLTLLVGRTYLPETAVRRNATRGRTRLPLIVYVVGALAVIAFMAEGAVADWSGLFLHDELHATEALAALGYPLFELAMLGGRLVGDRLRARYGTRRMLTTAGLAAAAAMTVVATAPNTRIALAGFLLTGAMICTIVPTMLSLAGTIAPGRADASVAQVGAMGYGGLLLGPVVIGFVAELSSLRVGLAVVVAASLLVALAARLLPLDRFHDVAVVETVELEPAGERELVAAA